MLPLYGGGDDPFTPFLSHDFGRQTDGVVSCHLEEAEVEGALNVVRSFYSICCRHPDYLRLVMLMYRCCSHEAS